MTIIRVGGADKNFIELVAELDKELAVVDGEDHGFYNQYNKVDLIRHVVLAVSNGEAVACGAIKEFDPDTAEIKRMYTKPLFRSKGLASIVLRELEKWCSELGYLSCILETGKRQPDAIRLYQKNGYQQIPNYGQYAGVENSVCFSKALDKSAVV